MSEKDIPIVNLHEFLSGPQIEQRGAQPVGKQWHAILEAVLFASPTPLTIDELRSVLEDVPKNSIHQCLLEIQKNWEEAKHGIQLVEVASGWQLRTHPAAADYVRKLQHIKPKKLSKAAMEALAVVAYRQPVTRSEVEQIRGVDSSAVIYKLVQQNLVQVVGKKEEDPGKPELLGTTAEFLSHFNLRDLLSLPSLAEPIHTSNTGGPIVSPGHQESLDPLAAMQVHLNPRTPTKS